MIRRPLKRAAALAAGSCLFWGGSSLVAAATAAGAPAAASSVSPTPLVLGATAVPSIGVDFGSGVIGAASSSNDLLAATAAPAESVATIPLPPSAYPGRVGLATAALSVWRYRRRRR